ncbi:dynein axonemal heavy chain 2 isoform X1 [Hylaeus anthracinus]|uniref:dynein axonemal heavy chain 2 isoform X1 n=1 Tax=Hylaeus anthracinus TaxID=313031 RepID=UPI0023BA1BF6|nr:dynein axonemal heavy chain 2 isoform X1 [Hylaeus anthracinus]
MSAKKEKSESSKKSDKMIDTHREFLDMDTDEEDFGRQESPEVEEELPPEPEKPVFSEGDLVTLVQHVKDLTIFSSLDKNWNEKCDKVVREYFENPSHFVLCIFHEESKLTAILNIPNYAPKGFVYFLRSPWQIYTPDNFRSTVSFGSISKNTKSSILKFMENIYAPVILRSNDCASLIQNEVFSNLHEFIIRLTAEVYDPMGLTTLYVPKENIFKTFVEPSKKIDCFLLGEDIKAVLLEKDERQRKLVDRLEKVVWSWIRQIYKERKITSSRTKIESIQDEVNYWNAKYLNLAYLNAQLLNPEVQLIIKILGNLCSLSANKFQELTKHIEKGLKETSSNLMYLNILLDFCKNLTVPEDAENSITEALLLILFIWIESPFYNTTNNIEILCQAFSSQIIHQCKNYIMLDVALGSNPEDGMEILKKCIFCCDIYKIIYDNLTMNVVSYINIDKKWDINKAEVFNKINTFKQRCYDVFEICDALLIFGRYNKIGLFGGTRGIEYEAYWREIENIFYEILNEIIAARDIIFDITKSNWLKKYRRFKYTILQLENMVINLINDIFKNVKNIEEGIEAIYTLQKFNKRDNLREILQTKWIQVWTIFNNEIKYCYINAVNVSKICERSTQKTNVNMNMSFILQYIKTQHNKMINAMDWIGNCAAEQCILQQYKHVLDVIDERRKMINTYSTYGTQ